MYVELGNVFTRYKLQKYKNNLSIKLIIHSKYMPLPLIAE